MYSKGDKVRVDGVNTLKTIIEIIVIKGKNLYVCDDGLWYDEELLYPADVILRTNIILGQESFISDFGKKDDVLKEFSNYINNDVTEDEFKVFLNFVKNSEMELKV